MTATTGNTTALAELTTTRFSDFQKHVCHICQMWFDYSWRNALFWHLFSQREAEAEAEADPSAVAEPVADADADAVYGYYGHGLGYTYGYPLNYAQSFYGHGLGYGHGYGLGYVYWSASCALCVVKLKLCHRCNWQNRKDFEIHVFWFGFVSVSASVNSMRLLEHLKLVSAIPQNCSPLKCESESVKIKYESVKCVSHSTELLSIKVWKCENKNMKMKV